MQTRKEISELIEKLLNDELSPREKQEVLTLISQNDYLQKEFILRQKIDRAIQKTDVMEFRQELEALIRDKKGDGDNLVEEPPLTYYKWHLAAAVVIVLVAIGFGLSRFIPTTELSVQDQPRNESSTEDDTSLEVLEMNTPTDANKETSPPLQPAAKPATDAKAETQDKEDNLLALNYKESAYFESFIDSYRSEDVEIDAPKPGERFSSGDVIQFKWRFPGNDFLLLQIYNNHEERLFKGNFINHVEFREKLKPGLYYWKLESENELISMNKFYID